MGRATRPSLLVTLFFLVSQRAGAAVFSIVGTFSDDDHFGVGELSARLEACASPDASPVLRADCVRKLISPEFACDGVGSDTVCVLDGIHLNVSAVSFSCDDERGCPSSDDTLNATLEAAVPSTGCARRPVSGFTDVCFPSAWCQWSEQPTDLTSFGRYCPSTLGVFCCGNDATAAETAFPGGFVTPGGTLDYLEQMSHAADLSFRLTFDVAPPSSVRVIVDTPYVTSDSTLTSIVNGVARETRMCPSAYLFGFQDPLERLPPERAGDYRRATTQEEWTPLTFFPVDDLLGKPRSACGNYDFEYTSDGDFRSKFHFPDVVPGGFAYGATPAVDTSVWNASVAPRDIPFGNSTWWTIGTPRNGRVNYTMGYWDLVTGYYGCRDYATGERLVQRRVENDFAYYMGVPYQIETYSWTMHMCQVGFYGTGCEDTSLPQMYAKTCAIVPVSFTVAPQQMSAVSTDSSSSSLKTKTFLQSVESIASDCPAGDERVAIVFHLAIFDAGFNIVEESVHDVSPASFFESTPHDNFHITDVGTFELPIDFLKSNPTTEGFYKLKTSTIDAADGPVNHQKIILLTKCFFTGLDARRRRRARPGVFADAISSENGIVRLDIEIMFRRSGLDVDVRNTLNARIIATRETFMLREEIALESRSAEAVHRLYGSYESAREDTGIVPNALPEGSVLRGGDQLCSKHQAHGTHAASIGMRPNAVGACLLSETGNARTDGEGIQLAGREILYRASGMENPMPFTFGCERDWINVENTTASPEGVYELGRLELLPDDNHERVFWFVVKANVNEMEMGVSGRKLSDVFGVGLFHYDDRENVQRVHKSDDMQTDSVTDVMDTDELTPGCIETQGNLKASCNLVCWTIVQSLLTGGIGQDRTLMVHHVSIATIANEVQTESEDRFQKKKRRNLAAVEQAGEIRTETEEKHERTQILTVRNNMDVNTTNGHTPSASPDSKTTTEDLLAGILIGALAIASVVVFIICFKNACIPLCFYNKYKTRSHIYRKYT